MVCGGSGVETKHLARPSWYGSVDRVLVCGLKGPGFDSGQGHMPRLWDQPPVRGVQEGADQ